MQFYVMKILCKMQPKFCFIGMANTMPWLLSMSLLGVPKFAAYTAPNILSRDLQAPALPLTSSISTPQFFSHVRRNISSIVNYLVNL